MIKEITIPNLGLTMEKAKIVEWLKQEEEVVKEDEVVLTIETDKLTYEITSPQSGFLHIIGQKGQDYPVNEVVGWVAKTKAEYESNLKKEKAVPSVQVPGPEKRKEEEKKEEVREKVSIVLGKGKHKPFFAAPLARKIAAKKGIDLSTIQGTGPKGRITKKDVIRVFEAGRREIIEKPKAIQEVKDTRDLKVIREIVPIRGRRAVILKNMRHSLEEAAQMTLTMEVDAAEMVRLRNVKLEQFEKEGIRISYNAILAKILACVLTKYPRFNSSVDGDQIVLWESINIGLAMDAEEGLIVPVIRDVDKKDLKAIQKDIDDLAERVKTKKLMPDDIKGGTFTLSSLGYLDIEAFTPIINQPEVAILGVGKILEKPVVINGEIKSGIRMMLSLTFDHRVVDGAEAARFLREVKRYIEEPYLI